MNYLLTGIGWVVGQTVGLGIILLSFQYYQRVFSTTKKPEEPIAEFFIGTVLLLCGAYAVIFFSIFTLLGDFDKLRLTYVWTFPFSILINYYLFFQFPKTEFYKQRFLIKNKKKKEPSPMTWLINFSFNSGTIAAGSILIFAGILNFLYAILIWFKQGSWEVLSIGAWLSSFDKFDTGWKGIDKILNYLIFDINAIFLLIIVGFIFLTLPKANAEE